MEANDGFWAKIKGWRTMIIACLAGGLSAGFGALTMLDWSPVLQDFVPQLPGWAIVLLAAFIGGALRTITTTPMGGERGHEEL